tara:strand:+ start:1879 stop:2100 length:222 start_codon:yes stop_codon:yes gene_type:complete
MRRHHHIHREEDTMLQIGYPRLMHPLAVSESVLCSSSGADKMFKEVVVSAHIREIKFRLAPLAGAALILGEES